MSCLLFFMRQNSPYLAGFSKSHNCEEKLSVSFIYQIESGKKNAGLLWYQGRMLHL